MTNVTNRYRRNFDVFKDKVGSQVLNTRTGKLGVVTAVRETAFEYIEPFVTYDGTKEEVKESTLNLVVVIE
jgi:hypothetical protein